VIDRRQFIGLAAGGALVGGGALKVASEAESALPLTGGTEFVRTGAPPLRIVVPQGWVVHENWDPGSVNPIPVVALSKGGAVPLVAESSVLNVHALPADAAVLTIGGVPLAAEPVYLTPSARAHTLTPHDVHADAREAGTSLFSWVVATGGEWGYLVHGWIGSAAGDGSREMWASLATLRFE
jgi:hypothetical protein